MIIYIENGEAKLEKDGVQSTIDLALEKITQELENLEKEVEDIEF